MSCQKPQKPRAGDEPDGAGGCRILRRGGCCISAVLLPDERGCTRGPSCPPLALKENLSSHGGRRLLHPPKQRSPTLDPKWQQHLHSHVTDLTDMTNSAESSGRSESEHEQLTGLKLYSATNHAVANDTSGTAAARRLLPEIAHSQGQHARVSDSGGSRVLACDSEEGLCAAVLAQRESGRMAGLSPHGAGI